MGHSIGDNDSVETYVWKGRNSTPYKHYVRFRCEHCGGLFRILHSDATLTFDNTNEGKNYGFQ